MPMQIIEDTNSGQRIGSALGQALQGLAQAKVNDLGQRNQRLGSQLGLQALKFTPEQASNLQYLDPKILQEVAKQKVLAPQNQAYMQALNQLLGGESAASPIGEQQGAVSGMQQGVEEQPIIPAGINQQQATKLAELGLQKQKMEVKSAKEVRDFLKPYATQAEAAKKDIRDYDLLTKLAKKKDLRAGNTHAALAKVGLEDFNQSLTTQIAGKTVARLGQNAAAAFGPGARLTNFLEQTFQKSLPTLWNTPKGLEVISQLNRKMAEGVVFKNDEINKLVRQWKGRIPYDSEAQLQERIGPKLQELDHEALSIAMSAELPSASDYEPDTIVESDGNTFGIKNGHWQLLEG